MQKLNLPSLYAGGRSLKDVEGEKWYKMYMKTPDGNNLHYYWLLNMIEQISIQQGIHQNIDEYDD